MKRLTPEEKIVINKLYSEGKTQRQIGEVLGRGKSTIGDYLRDRVEQSAIDTQPLDTTPSKRFASHTPPTPVTIVTTKTVRTGGTHIMIPDLQVKPDIDTAYLSWIGEYLAHKKPDVIINIGDHFDLPSLSSYDKGTKKAEGKHLQDDIDAGIEGMNLLLQPIADLQQQELEEFGEVRYKPKMVFTLGNHEQRLERHLNANPELTGLVSYGDFKLEENGWEVYDFLEPAVVDGVMYIHYMPNPMTGKPYGGQALSILKNVGCSVSMGHKQCLDVATRSLPTGQQQWFLICGAGYPHKEGYKGYTGNHHFRGVVVKHRVSQGSYDPMFVNLDYLKGKYNA